MCVCANTYIFVGMYIYTCVCVFMLYSRCQHLCPPQLTEVRNLYREKLDLYHRSLKVHRERMMKDEELKRAVLRKDPSERTHEENLFVVC